MYILFYSVTGRIWFSLLAFHECPKALLTKQTITEPQHVYSHSSSQIPLSCLCTHITQLQWCVLICHICSLQVHAHPVICYWTFLELYLLQAGTEICFYLRKLKVTLS